MPEMKAISANRSSFKIYYDSISSEVTGHSVGAIAHCSISYIREEKHWWKFIWERHI